MLISDPKNVTLYGKGVFTTGSFYDSEPFLWGKHWSRLTDNAAHLAIDISDYSEEDVKKAVSKAIEQSGSVNGRIRITVVDESTNELWGIGEVKTGLLITIGERRHIPVRFRLSVSPYLINTTSPLTGIKSCNYLEHLMAFEEAMKRGFNEAIRLNERGEVSSACMANVFWLKDGKLITPSLKTGCLPGTTREYVLESLDCLEVEAAIAELDSADDIFLTSAGIGVVQAEEFDGRLMRKEPHEILDLLPKPI